MAKDLEYYDASMTTAAGNALAPLMQFGSLMARNQELENARITEQTRFAIEMDERSAVRRQQDNQFVLARMDKDRENQRLEFQQFMEMQKFLSETQARNIATEQAVLQLEEQKARAEYGRVARAFAPASSALRVALNSKDIGGALVASKSMMSHQLFSKLSPEDQANYSALNGKLKELVLERGDLKGKGSSLMDVQAKLDGGTVASQAEALAELKRNGVDIEDFQRKYYGKTSVKLTTLANQLYVANSASNPLVLQQKEAAEEAYNTARSDVEARFGMLLQPGALEKIRAMDPRYASAKSIADVDTGVAFRFLDGRLAQAAGPQAVQDALKSHGTYRAAKTQYEVAKGKAGQVTGTQFALGDDFTDKIDMEALFNRDIPRHIASREDVSEDGKRAMMARVPELRNRITAAVAAYATTDGPQGQPTAQALAAADAAVAELSSFTGESFNIRDFIPDNRIANTKDVVAQARERLQKGGNIQTDPATKKAYDIVVGAGYKASVNGDGTLRTADSDFLAPVPQSVKDAGVQDLSRSGKPIMGQLADDIKTMHSDFQTATASRAIGTGLQLYAPVGGLVKKGVVAGVTKSLAPLKTAVEAGTADLTAAKEALTAARKAAGGAAEELTKFESVMDLEARNILRAGEIQKEVLAGRKSQADALKEVLAGKKAERDELVRRAKGYGRNAEVLAEKEKEIKAIERAITRPEALVTPEKADRLSSLISERDALAKKVDITDADVARKAALDVEVKDLTDVLKTLGDTKVADGMSQSEMSKAMASLADKWSSLTGTLAEKSAASEAAGVALTESEKKAKAAIDELAAKEGTRFVNFSKKLEKHFGPSGAAKSVSLVGVALSGASKALEFLESPVMAGLDVMSTLEVNGIDPNKIVAPEGLNKPFIQDRSRRFAEAFTAAVANRMNETQREERGTGMRRWGARMVTGVGESLAATVRGAGMLVGYETGIDKLVHSVETAGTLMGQFDTAIARQDYAAAKSYAERAKKYVDIINTELSSASQGSFQLSGGAERTIKEALTTVPGGEMDVRVSLGDFSREFQNAPGFVSIGMSNAEYEQAFDQWFGMYTYSSGVQPSAANRSLVPSNFIGAAVETTPAPATPAAAPAAAAPAATAPVPKFASENEAQAALKKAGRQKGDRVRVEIGTQGTGTITIQ